MSNNILINLKNKLLTFKRIPIDVTKHLTVDELEFINTFINDNKLTTYTVRDACIIIIENIPLSSLYCLNCGCLMPFSKRKQCFCSRKCSFSTIGKQMRSESLLKNYGVTCVFKLDSIKQKIRETTIQKYGKPSYTQTEEYKYRSKKTSIKNWGVDNPSKSQIIKNKKIQTCLLNYGKEYGFIALNDEERELKYKHNIEKYGTKFPCQSPQIKAKIKEQIKAKYGVDSYAKTDEYKQQVTLRYYNRLSRFKHEVLPLFDVNESKLKWTNHLFKWKCTHCGNIFFAKWPRNGLIPRCMICYPHIPSIHQKNVFTYIKTIYTGKCRENDKTLIKPLEIDIALYDINLAIEFNGLYFHSISRINDHNYHAYKTQKCATINYNLIHIYENIWLTKQEIIKSKLYAFITNNYNNVLNATYHIISKNEANAFYNQYGVNFIFNNNNGYIGIFDNGNLIAVFAYNIYNDGLSINNIEIQPNVYISNLNNLIQDFIKSINVTNTCIIYEDNWITKNIKDLHNIDNIKSVEKINPIFFYCNNLGNTMYNVEDSDDMYINMRKKGYYKIYNSGFTKISL